jgi:dTDP-4-dehydrorhamnose 3,5-epimerase
MFRETSIVGSFLLDPERIEDERGFFARTFAQDEFADRDLSTAVAQCSISYNARRATLRGLHYQVEPHAETKLVRCTSGEIFDVIADLREDSETFGRWEGWRLSARNRLSLYIPEGVAHGFETLEDDCEVLYQISTFYDAGSAAGVRWDDPTLGIAWPLVPEVMSQRDADLPDLDDRRV